MDVIYCAGGNRRLAIIAIEEGFLYGARSDDLRTKIRCNGMVDINWKKYNWDDHVRKVMTNNPKYAAVPDILDINQLEVIIGYAEQLLQYSSNVIVIPKVNNIISLIPQKFIIGVSIPTSYAGFLPDTKELLCRNVHLLGGTPRQQREIWNYYRKMNILVTSVDINCHSKASDFGSYWTGSRWCDNERETIGKYGAFRKSCQGIMKMWKKLGAI